MYFLKNTTYQSKIKVGMMLKKQNYMKVLMLFMAVTFSFSNAAKAQESAMKTLPKEPITFIGGINIKVSTHFPVVQVDGELLSVVFADTGQAILGVQGYPVYLVAGANLLVSTVENSEGAQVYVVESPQLCIDGNTKMLMSDVGAKWTYEGRPIQLVDQSAVISSCGEFNDIDK